MKPILLVILAFAAGLAGGVVSTLLIHSAKRSPIESVVRARSFELVDRTGLVLSYWGVDKGDNVVLAFGSRPGTILDEKAIRPVHFPGGLLNPLNQRAAIGLLGNDSPFLFQRGADGKTRMRLYLSDYAKPFLLMEDETGPRVSLGVEQSDTPGPEDNDWALSFMPDRAWLGMHTQEHGGKTYVQGGFSVQRDKLMYPYDQR